MADRFVSNYQTKLAAANAAVAKADDDLKKIGHDEMASDVKGSDITKFAQQKAKLYDTKNTIAAEKPKAASLKAQIDAIDTRVKTVDDEIERITRAEINMGKPSEVTKYANMKAKLYEDKGKELKRKEDLGKDAAKLKYF